VSRIPDGRSIDVLVGALEARPPVEGSRSGIRNLKREYAESVYRLLPGSTPLLISEPVVATWPPQAVIDGSFVYLCLHGNPFDGARFWGEQQRGQHIEALNIDGVPERFQGVVLAGCCWSALVGALPSSITHNRRWEYAVREPDESIALTFLRSGARPTSGPRGHTVRSSDRGCTHCSGGASWPGSRPPKLSDWPRWRSPEAFPTARTRIGPPPRCLGPQDPRSVHLSRPRLVARRALIPARRSLCDRPETRSPKSAWSADRRPAPKQVAAGRALPRG